MGANNSLRSSFVSGTMHPLQKRLNVGEKFRGEKFRIRDAVLRRTSSSSLGDEEAVKEIVKVKYNDLPVYTL